jgi:hypothetical protein
MAIFPGHLAEFKKDREWLKHTKKQQITDALTEVRIQVQHQLSRLSRSLDMKQHFQGSIKDHPWEWASGAAIFGWLLSRVPARKKNLY